MHPNHHGAMQYSRMPKQDHRMYPQEQRLYPSKSGAFVRYQPRYAPAREELPQRFDDRRDDGRRDVAPQERLVEREEGREGPPVAEGQGVTESTENPEKNDEKKESPPDLNPASNDPQAPNQATNNAQTSSQASNEVPASNPVSNQASNNAQGSLQIQTEKHPRSSTNASDDPALLEAPPAKRTRNEIGMDDMTPKAGVYRGPQFFQNMAGVSQGPMSQGLMMSQGGPTMQEMRPHSTLPPSKSPHQLRPIRSRSFSYEETRDDSHHHARAQDSRDRASYSPNSLISRRSFDVSLDQRLGSASFELRGMSWEGSFGVSPQDMYAESREENAQECGNLPPLPSLERGGFPLAPRPVKMMDSRAGGLEPREFYRGYNGPNGGGAQPMMRDRDRMYYTRSPPRREPRYHDDRYYDDRYRSTSAGKPRYESRYPDEGMIMVDRRDPYDSHRGHSYRRYEEDMRHSSSRRSPPPPARDAYFAYPNDTPGGLSSRSFDSRSLGEMDEPINSLLYRPSFSWERGLDMPYNDYNESNAILVQLSEQQKMMKALALRNEIRTIGNPHNSIGLILLLAMPNDRHCLSETLCIIRNNVEVFTATEADISAPAPGRKRPIQVGQVGLRCVYCRMCTNDRVKRAMCFPSSTKRIYRALIDMKLDHFPMCPYIPSGLKQRLEELSASSSRSTGMTVQYFVKSAKEMGMVDMEEGMYIDLRRVGKDNGVMDGYGGFPPQEMGHGGGRAMVPQENKSPPNKVQFKPNKPAPVELDPNIKRFHGKVLLSLPDDSSFLSPLRCFLRRNVCAFTATSNDIAIRTPTTFSVRVGQVGVGCVHCLSVPPKQRSNRAVCFPFTVARIYQSVADIQRFHLGECKMMPPEVRAEFLQLQSESAKGSRGLATRTYWIDSARKIGLADGPGGMYFSRDPALPPTKDEESLDLLAQVATNANTNFKPLVTPEDKPTIAEFLYVVMQQLQPCLFTDADRNKRRSKNIGSIGVECKHCAGKIDGRKFFWSSVSAAESNFVSVHSHMMTCKYISDELKADLAKMKALRREQTSRLRTGSQKAFFTRVWNRLHSKDDDAKDNDKKPAALKSKPDPALSAKVEELTTAKSLDVDTPFDSMILETGGSQDEIRALLESKSTLSSMPSIDDIMAKPEAHEVTHHPEESKPESDIKMGGSGDSAIAIKNSLSSVAHELSTVSVRSKEVEQDTIKTAEI